MICTLLLSVCALFDPGPGEALRASPGDRWPGFRGVGTSHTAAKELPLRWSADDNVAWTVRPTGFGQSSPIVWQGTVFVTSVEGPKKDRCIVSAFRLTDGVQLWSRGFDAGVLIESTNMVSRSAPTPAVDGERVYAFFESGDFFALDHNGELLWHRSLCVEYGPFEGNHGVGSSVVLGDDAAYLLLDHAGPSYLLALNKRTGENLWKADREPRVSWTTPFLARDFGSTELVVSSNGFLEGFDPKDGSVRWTLEGISGDTVPSPTAFGGQVFVAASKGDDNLLVRRGSSEQPAEILWRPSETRPSGFGSPLVAHGRVYLVNKSGVLYCMDLASGELLWDQRLAQSCWASPVAVGDLVYFFGKEGMTTVLRPGSEGGEVVAENEIPTEATVYGVALVDGSIVVREGDVLRCLRELPEEATQAE